MSSPGIPPTSLRWQSRITLSGGSCSDLLDPKVQPGLRTQLRICIIPTISASFPDLEIPLFSFKCFFSFLMFFSLNSGQEEGFFPFVQELKWDGSTLATIRKSRDCSSLAWVFYFGFAFKGH